MIKYVMLNVIKIPVTQIFMNCTFTHTIKLNTHEFLIW